MPAFAVCITCLVAPRVQGQSRSDSRTTAKSERICEGISPAEQPGGDDAPASSAGSDRNAVSLADEWQPQNAKGQLKLSIDGKPPEPSGEAVGQLCLRGTDTARASGQVPVKRSEGKLTRVAQQGPAPVRAPSQEAGQSVLPPAPAAVAPPAPPVAQLSGGKLIIHANGQHLTQVLDAIRSLLGLVADPPPDGGAEPIFMNMGPSSPREVLIALLDGSRYNYILIGSLSDPQKISRVVLSARSTSETASPVTVAANPTPAQPTLYGGQGVQPDPDSDFADGSGIGPQIQPSELPSSVPTGVDIQQLATKEGKTPGQVLDELQKRQMEVLDQQTAAPPGSAPPQ